MAFSSLLIGVTFISLVIASAVSKPDRQRDSVHEAHIHQEHHDTTYDHEMFMGKNESKTFDQLSPEESKRRLGVIVGKIDSDGNELVEVHELKNWIQYNQRQYIEDNVRRQWNQLNPGDSETITWDVYKKNMYGFVDEVDFSDLEEENNGLSYKLMLSRDRRRWKAADKTGDDELTRDEFLLFLHPEDALEMQDIVVTETIEDIDKDKDGKISVDEYIGDMYRSEPGEEEPDWVLREREAFAAYRDSNGDGNLDKDEVLNWITPKNFDHAQAEAEHLVFEADLNGDGKLTKNEIIEKYDLFVGSQATDFGEMLTKHDEF